MRGLADAFGMLAAALYIEHEPWLIRVPKPTPLCLVWGEAVAAPARVAPGSWLAGWTGLDWPAAAHLLAAEGSEARRLGAYTLGVLAQQRWDEARRREHVPHLFRATLLEGRYRCRCGAWARVVYGMGRRPERLERCGRSKWAGLDRRLARETAEHEAGCQLRGGLLDGRFPPLNRADLAEWQTSKALSTARVDQVFAGTRRPT